MVNHYKGADSTSSEKSSNPIGDKLREDFETTSDPVIIHDILENDFEAIHLQANRKDIPVNEYDSQFGLLK